MSANIVDRIFHSGNDFAFEPLALEVFRYQASSNIVYGKFLEELGCGIPDVGGIEEIPFLPISLFKSSEVKSGVFEAELVFKSSGTGLGRRSSHYVKSLDLYRRSFLKGFGSFYGSPADFTIYALLPSYIENGDSSLVYMSDHMIRQNNHGRGGFFLNEYSSLLSAIKTSLDNKEKVMLIGVTWALLEFAGLAEGEDLSELIVVETGGMKGRRREMLRDEVHAVLKSAMCLKSVHSEYGMTELMSQAWSYGNGVFDTPDWMKVLIRDPLDPACILNPGRSGGINIIDLANIHSCSFIETSDLGLLHENGSFEISGRFDNSDLRGCNLLV